MAVYGATRCQSRWRGTTTTSSSRTSTAKSSALTQVVSAPAVAVWSVVRLFDEPQVYKHFIKSCGVLVLVGDDDMGTLREVCVVSGLHASLHQHRAPRDPRRRERWA
ncbi:abscisic acid receptor PYL4-like [Canna indica]|uniref:Abscisic acid receptor PYL4-like n=1 Tax=Canna indica TaxID=4628 RepID=A0AAQ3KCN2_9LILI|nr:abscisic acid receptor PYL4-like [Canna indica]